MTSDRLSMGGLGPIYLTGTAPSAIGRYYAIQASGAGCTLSNVMGLDGDFNGATLAPGNILRFGSANVTRATLSAGSAFLYKRL